VLCSSPIRFIPLGKQCPARDSTNVARCFNTGLGFIVHPFLPPYPAASPFGPACIASMRAYIKAMYADIVTLHAYNEALLINIVTRNASAPLGTVPHHAEQFRATPSIDRASRNSSASLGTRPRDDVSVH